MDPPGRLLGRIRAAFPTWPLSSVRLDPDGLVNDVVLVDGEWVCRFAKDERGVQALAREARILALVRRHVDLPVPAFEHQDSDWVVYRLIPGRPLNRHDLLELPEKQQMRLAEQLAAFLQQLHNVPQSELELSGVPRSDAQRTDEDWQRFYVDLEQALFPMLWNDQRASVAHHFAPVRDGRLSLSHQGVLIHGDLAQYHILYDDATGDLTGVIDFGTAGVGDPAGDFALIISMYGESFLRRVALWYAGIGEALDRARFLAGTLELQWALAGLRSGDRSWFVAHIGRARDVGAIGSNWATSRFDPFG